MNDLQTESNSREFGDNANIASGRQLDVIIVLVGDYLIFAVSTPLSIFGCVSNVVSLVIFFKQGRKDCVTICLFALGVSDFVCCFVVLVFSSLYSTNYITNFSVIQPMALDVVMSYIAAMFYDISQGITAFISLQRCLCVAMPLKFKNMFTVTRSAVIMVAFYVLTTAAYTPHFVTSGLFMMEDATRNISIPALWVTSDREENIFWLNYILHIGVDTFYQIVVVVSAVVMTTGLKKSSKFRQQESTIPNIDTKRASSQNECPGDKNTSTETYRKKPEKSRQPSDKHRNVVKTIFALSLLAIICNTERLSVVYGQRFVPGLTFDGAYHNIFFVSARVTFLFSMVNASLNIVVYYFLNPSYRKTFLTIFGCQRLLGSREDK